MLMEHTVHIWKACSMKQDPFHEAAPSISNVYYHTKSTENIQSYSFRTVCLNSNTVLIHLCDQAQHGHCSHKLRILKLPLARFVNTSLNCQSSSQHFVCLFSKDVIQSWLEMVQWRNVQPYGEPWPLTGWPYGKACLKSQTQNWAFSIGPNHSLKISTTHSLQTSLCP